MPTYSLMRPQADARRQQPRAAALMSRHFLRLVENTAEIGFWSADLTQDRLEASVGLFRVLGLDPTMELTFSFGLDMIHPDDQAAHLNQIAVLRSGQPIHREFRIIRPDRTQRWISHDAEVLVGPNGQPSQGIGVVMDITRRYESIRSIEQGHDRFKALLTSTAAVVWIVGPDGQALDMPQWQALTGQVREEYQGLGWTNALHPDDRERAGAAWRTAVSHAALYNTDYRILCADGVYRWFNSRGAPIMNPDGSIREWVGACLSIPGQNRFSEKKVDVVAVDDGSEAWMLTPEQLRAARGMTGLSYDELARRSNVSISTLRRLETDQTGTCFRPATLRAVRQALEDAGVEFLFDPSGKPGIRPC